MSNILETTVPYDVEEVVNVLFDFSKLPEAKRGKKLTGTPVVNPVSGVTIGPPGIIVEEVDNVPAYLGVMVTVSGGSASAKKYDFKCIGTFELENGVNPKRVVKGRLIPE